MATDDSFLNTANPSLTASPYFTSDYLLIPPIISSVSTAFVIIVSLSFKLHKSPLGIMILGINFSDFVYAFTKSIGPFIPVESNAPCMILVFVGNISLRASILWGALFGHALLITITHHGLHILRMKIKWYLFFSIMIPFALSIPYLFLSYVRYDESAGICIIISEAVLNFVLLKTTPIILGIFLSMYWYIRAARNLAQIMAIKSKGQLLTLLVFPMIELICWLPAITTQLIQKLDGPSESYPNALSKTLQSFAYLQGFFDAMVYGRSVNMLGMIWQKCRRGSSDNGDRGILSLEKLEQSKTESFMQRIDISFSSEVKEDPLTESLTSGDDLTPVRRDVITN